MLILDSVLGLLPLLLVLVHVLFALHALSSAEDFVGDDDKSDDSVDSFEDPDSGPYAFPLLLPAFDKRERVLETRLY